MFSPTVATTGFPLKFSFLLFTFIWMTGCDKNEDPGPNENVHALFKYEINGETKTEDAEAFIYDDSIIVMSTEDLSFYFDGIVLQKKNLSQSAFSEVIVSGTYSTNVVEENTGFIQIENWDERNIQISGSFSFNAFDSFDTTNIVTVRSGNFKEISVFRTNQNYYKGKARAKFKNQNIAYRLVNTQLNTEENILEIRLRHPSKNDFTLSLDASLTAGTYNIEDLDAAQFALQYEDRVVEQNLYIESGCTLTIKSIDLTNENLSLEIAGNFSDEFTTPFPIESLDIEVFRY